MPAEPVHKDPVLPLTDMRHSIDIDAKGDGKWVGQRLRRKEDARLIRGRGYFVDDKQSSDMLHVTFVRSPYAHAKIVKIDTSAADAMAGVSLTMTGKQVIEQAQPLMQIGSAPGNLIKDYGIAVDRVRYQGEPVVLVVADSMRLAQDAAELIEVEYDVLPALVVSEESLQSDQPIHEEVGSNLVWEGTWDHGDVDKAFAEAAHVVKIGKLHFHRFSSTPIETAGAVVSWSRTGEIDIFANSGLPPINSQMISAFLGVSTEQIRSRTHDVGGNFGTKTVTYPFVALTALASKNLGGRELKWVETRTDNLQSFHGGERSFFDTEVALDKDGVITGLRSRHLDDCGAYARYEPLGAVIWSQVYCHTFTVKNLHIDFSQVVSNKPPCTPNRGYSRLQHMWFMERVMDICAHELNIPAEDMRARNLIQPEEFPYTTPNGCVYDSGNYPLMMEKAKELIGWDEWRKKQEEAKKEGRLIGLGMGMTLDSGTNNFGQSYIVNPDSIFSGNTETARIKIGLDGSIVVMLGSVPQGQGHETVAAQVIADDLNISPDMVNVRIGFDSNWNAYSGLSGTIASQFVVTGLSAVHGAAEKLKAELKKIAAFSLEASEEELELGVGEMGPQVSVKGQPEKAINYWMLSNLVSQNTAKLPEELRDIDFNVKYTYRPPFELPDTEKKYGNLTLTYAALLNAAVVEIDPVTYQPKILEYVYVDDCGVAINPQIVEGQVTGGVAHGIGAAMQEAFQFDKSGNMITATFTDYAPLTSLNMPDLKHADIESPSPFSYNGAKGCGESGGTALQTINAAIQDALHSKGVIINDSHSAPSILMEAVKHPNRDTFVDVEHR
nr:putative aldehyde oxidase and xanthine dehydrogenase molybdopterin binding protein [uncultured bacterium]